MQIDRVMKHFTIHLRHPAKEYGFISEGNEVIFHQQRVVIRDSWVVFPDSVPRIMLPISEVLTFDFEEDDRQIKCTFCDKPYWVSSWTDCPSCNKDSKHRPTIIWEG